MLIDNLTHWHEVCTRHIISGNSCRKSCSLITLRTGTKSAPVFLSEAAQPHPAVGVYVCAQPELRLPRHVFAHSGDHCHACSAGARAHHATVPHVGKEGEGGRGGREGKQNITRDIT